MQQFSALVDRMSPSQAKIALFRSLFRGREDVYARRFESRKTGRSGYAPACANEWARGICEKPRIKCAECPHRRLLPVTDEVIRWHLSGCDGEGQPFVAGVYPLLQDETRATSIVKSMRELRQPFVFPSPGLDGGPLSNMAMLTLLRRIDADKATTVHGLCRATFSTWAYETAASRPDVIEACLAHRESDRVKAAYNRAQFAAERRTLLLHWAEYLQGEVQTNVSEPRVLRAA